MILEAKNIWKTFKHGNQKLDVLKDVDVTVDEGEVVAIVGPSGAGKSTLLHIIGGLDKPSKGIVTIDGDDIYQLKDKYLAGFRNKHIGFVFQFYHLLPEFSALENVMLPAMIKDDRLRKKELESKAKELLDAMGLAHRLTHKPSQLSGGEQQRVAIARALINQPKVILCDEPTGNLNSEVGHEIIDLLMDLNKKNKQTLIIVTHDDQIAKRSGRVVHMRDGKWIKDIK